MRLFNFNFNFNFIKGNNNKVAQDGSAIESSEGMLQSLSAQLEELQKSSPYSIQAIDVNNSNIQSQEGLINRPSIIADIIAKLEEHRCVILNGDILIGKSCLAEIVALTKRDLTPLILKTYNEDTLNPTNLIPFIVESGKCKLLIIDGLPEYNVEITESLSSQIQNAVGNGLQVLITTRSFSTLIANKYNFVQFTVPVLTSEELMGSVPHCNEGLAKLIISTSGGYPKLVNLLLFYLDTNNWNLKEQQIIDFISIPNKSELQEYVNRKVREIMKDTQDLQLLSRLSLFWRPFSEDDAIALAGVNPILVTPKDRIRRLLTQRLLQQTDGKLRVSPFVKKLWSIDLLNQEYKECANVIIERVVHKQTIDVLDVDNAIMLLCNAKEYERAGWFYSISMTKFVEMQCPDASQVSLLTMLWRDLPLPSEMSVFTRTFIRLLQIQLASITKEDSSYATEDLLKLIYELPASSPLKAIASCYAIGLLSYKGDLQKALPLLEFAQPAITPDLNEENLALIEEQKDIADKLPVLILASINNLADLMQWFDKMEHSDISTESIDADAVKFVLNKVVELGNEETSLCAIIDRTKGLEVYTIFRIMSVARLMLFLSDKKRFYESWKLYEDNKDLEHTEIGNIVINNALACYYHDIKDIDNALQCWETSCSGNAIALCPEEVMLASSTMASVYCQRGDTLPAVQCLEKIINNPSFESVLCEYQQMQMRGELAIAYWSDGQTKKSFEQLLAIHHYLYSNRLASDDDYKLLEMNFGICVQQYYYRFDHDVFAEESAKPMLTMFQRPNKQFLEVYNKARTGTNIMYLFMMAASLGIAKETALLLAHRTIECFSDLIKEKNVACGLLTELNPLLLEYDDYESAEYLVKSSLGLVPSMQDAVSPLRLVCYLPLLPLCIKKVIDTLSGNPDRINRIIASHINDSLAVFPGVDEVTVLKEIVIDKNISKYSNILEDNAKLSARLCNFESLDLLASINVMIIASMFFQVHQYYGQGLLRKYVYHHAKYVISKFNANFRSAYKDPLNELENVQSSSLDDLSATKKMLRLIVAFSNVEVPLTHEHEDFIEI